MKILCTGGAGFIGSHLCELLSKDHTVWSLDNYFTGSKNNHVPNVEYITGHTKDIHKLNFKPDLIYHLAEYSRVEQSFDDHELVWDYNIDGTHAVIDFALQQNAKLVYAGSSTKFGDNGPNSSPYAYTKANNTQLVKNYGEWFGLKYAITYFYNVVGPREISVGPYATVIAKFLNKLRNNEKAVITLPGIQKRNFTHVLDTVEGLKLVGEMGDGDGYCIGAKESYSIIEIADMLDLNWEFSESEHRGNRLFANLDTSKMKELGWSQKHKLSDYLMSEKAKIL